MPIFWYVLYTFNCNELKISDYLKSKGLSHFIPMMYVEKFTREGKRKRLLVPVVHNMIFVRKDESTGNLLKCLVEAPVSVRVLRKDHSMELYEIPDRDMVEFRTLCDPDFADSHFMSSSEAEAKPGKTVEVVHGPFKGMTGKLHRVHNKFYFIKTLAGLGVMIRISRWYCRTVD